MVQMLLKRVAAEKAIASNYIVARDEVIYEFPVFPNTKGAIKVGTGHDLYRDLPYLLAPGEGPTSPDAILGVAQMLADAIKIKKEIKELICGHMD
jgi:hypothetical protein